MSAIAATRFQRICASKLDASLADDVRAAGVLWVTARRDDALAAITGNITDTGAVQVMNSGGGNGKNFAAAIELTPLEVADIAQAALDEAAGKGSGPNGITIPSFGSACAQTGDAWPYFFLP